MRTLSFLGLDAAERPRLSATSIRQLARLGTVVRWPGLLFAAILSLAVPPRSSVGLALVLVWVTLYNAWGMIALHAALNAVYGQGFESRDVVLWSLIMVVAGAILAAYDRIVIGGVLPQAPGSTAATIETPVSSAAVPAVRLSPREQEVLQLVSEGYSNSMIAGRLHLSENTIKTYVENLLNRFNARNRAEAVAAASRQNLI